MNVEVLVATGDSQVRHMVARLFTQPGFRVAQAVSAADVRSGVARADLDLLVLGTSLADADGLSMLIEVRDAVDVPTIMIADPKSDADGLLGLSYGADDYVVKPFAPAELIARAHALLRRTRPGTWRTYVEFGEMVIDVEARRLTRAGETVELTVKEFELLFFLASNPHTALSRRALLQRVWNSAPEYQTPTTVTEHVRRLRQKIEPDPAYPRHIVAVHGIGYRFEPGPRAPRSPDSRSLVSAAPIGLSNV